MYQTIGRGKPAEQSIMKSSGVKRFLRQQLGIKASVTTIPCKARWIEASIMGSFDPATRQYVYAESFAETFRCICLKTVYPTSPVGDQSLGGNISTTRIAMLPHEWDQAIASFTRAQQPLNPWKHTPPRGHMKNVKGFKLNILKPRNFTAKSRKVNRRFSSR